MYQLDISVGRNWDNVTPFMVFSTRQPVVFKELKYINSLSLSWSFLFLCSLVLAQRCLVVDVSYISQNYVVEVFFFFEWIPLSKCGVNEKCNKLY